MTDLSALGAPLQAMQPLIRSQRWRGKDHFELVLGFER
jgi:hypothetical protein